MEADRKAMPGQESMPPDPDFLGKITYRVGNKVKYFQSSIALDFIRHELCSLI